MSKSTFNFESAQINIIRVLTDKPEQTYSENKPSDNLRLGQISQSINDYVELGYVDFPENLWIGATFRNAPIVRALWREVQIGETTIMQAFIFITRNE